MTDGAASAGFTGAPPATAAAPGPDLTARYTVTVGCVVFLAALANVTPHLIGVFFDDALYALVAKAIATGQGFVYPQLPGTPPAIHYPPAYPLLLAVVWKIAPPFPESTMWLKLVNPLVLGLGAAGAFRVGRQLLPWPAAAVAALVLLGFVSVPMQVLTNVLFSEPLFMATMFAGLLAAHALMQGAGGPRPAILAGALTGLVILTRTVGGVLLPALLLALAFERRWRDAALVLVTTVLVVLPWQLFVWKHAPGFPDVLRGSYGPYLEWVAKGYREGGVTLVLAVLQKNLAGAWTFLGIFFSPLVAAVRPAASVAAIVGTIAGIGFGLAARPHRVLALSVAGYLAVVFFWPYQIERFLWGAWPLLVLVCGYGIWSLAALLRAQARPRLAWAVVGVGVFLAIGHATYSARGLSRGWAGSASRRMAERMRPALDLMLGDPRLHGKLLASDIAPMLALYSGEQVVSLDILRVTDHLAEKTIPKRAAVITVLDAAFAPDAYVLLPDSPILAAFLRAERDPARHFREFTPAGAGARAFLLDRR